MLKLFLSCVDGIKMKFCTKETETLDWYYCIEYTIPMFLGVNSSNAKKCPT